MKKEFKNFLNESFRDKEFQDALSQITKELTKSVVSNAKGKIITFASRDGDKTKIGYDDANGKRNVLYTFYRPVKKDEEEKLFALIRKQYAVNESIQKINENSIGYVIVRTLALISQVHMWHFLIKSGQKHLALGEYYNELQDKVDGLAEKFVVLGGSLIEYNYTIRPYTSEEIILNEVIDFRAYVVTQIELLKDDSELAGIYDSLVDLQEITDSFAFKFNLE